MNFLEKFIANAVSSRADDWARMVDAGELVRRYVTPALPKTIDVFEPANVVGTALYGATDRAKAHAVHITFKARDLSDPAAIDLAYGTITKTAVGLQRKGWSVTPMPELEARNWDDGMDVIIKAVRTIPARKRLFRSPLPGRTLPLVMSFDAMPETARCRIVESTEHVPASTRKVRKIVCDEPAELAGVLATGSERIEAPA